MNTAWARQQTSETFAANLELQIILLRSDREASASIAAYRAEKLANRKQHDAHVLDYDDARA